MLKRLFDLAASLTGIVVLAPLFLVISIAVRLDSPGPALFRQIRIGLHGRPFQIYKFRTMRDSKTKSGFQISSSDDSRITKVGAVLRRTKLDELAQLFNVLRGNMSIVGPRPEVPKFVELYPEELRSLILSVRPGITDEASIEFRDEGKLLAGALDPEKIYVESILPRKIDLYARYAKDHSFLRDMSIILRTIGFISFR
jgi:lipopolysaccharide/colanic/teichoic acid biosynthesis glycosyltransferase